MSSAAATQVWPRAQAVRSQRRASWQALGTAFSLEALALAALFAWWALQPAKPALRMLPLEIQAPSPAPQPAPPAPPAPPPLTPVPPPPLVPQPVRPHTPPHPRAHPPTPPPAPAQAAPDPVQTAPVTPVETAAPAPATEPAPAAPAATAPAAPPGPSSEYIAKVRAAVQAAFAYPPAVAALGIARRTRVAFTLHGVTPVSARVLIGSGMNAMDRAALQSVQAAAYPPPPPEMQGADANFEVWVEFKP